TPWPDGRGATVRQGPGSAGSIFRGDGLHVCRSKCIELCVGLTNAAVTNVLRRFPFGGSPEHLPDKNVVHRLRTAARTRSIRHEGRYFENSTDTEASE